MATTKNAKAASTKGNLTRVREPETGTDKKAAKAAAGETKGTGKAIAAAKDAGNGKDKEPKVTIGSYAISLLKGGTGAKETLAKVLEKFPGANTKMASIYWYANHEGIKLQKPAVPKQQKEVVATA